MENLFQKFDIVKIAYVIFLDGNISKIKDDFILVKMLY
jgi:hypothetical protein